MIRRKKRIPLPAAPFPDWVRLDALPIEHDRARYAQKKGLSVLTDTEKLAAVARLQTYRAILKTITAASWGDFCLSGAVHAKTLARLGLVMPSASAEKRLAYDIPRGLTACSDEDEKAIRRACVIALADLARTLNFYSKK